MCVISVGYPAEIKEDISNQKGVTAPAVNKWENGNSMPDIMLLAPNEKDCKFVL
jgi:transcriptional regulator with XRE-family HTH domain